MSFTPLPTTLSTILADLDPARSRVVELGSGDGRFTAEIRRTGVPVTGIDRALPATGARASAVGDALFPPILAGSCDLVLAANLVRHLIPTSPDLDFLPTWTDLLAPGGWLFILEDEPTPRPKGAVRYRQLQEFLARVVPEGRGPLVGLGAFRDILDRHGRAQTWTFGGGVNRYPLDPRPVVAMLRGAELDPNGQAARLAADIDRDGLDPGRFWWAAFQRSQPEESRA